MKLEVPVGLYPLGTGKLLVVGGGSFQTIDFPIKPYQYERSEVDTPDAEKVKLIGGGDALIRKVWHENIPMRSMADGRTVPAIDYSLELVKDHPDVVRQLAGEPYYPYPMFMDIETESTSGHFSKSERDEIVSIQVKFPDTEVIMLYQEDEVHTEAFIVKEFLKLCAESPTGKAPDFIVGYNSQRFDIPYVRQRVLRLARKDPEVRELMIKTHRTNADVLYPAWISSAAGRKGSEIEMSRGFVALDLYLHAKKDLMLRDLPSRSLENVAKAYGSTDVVELEKEDKSRMRELIKHDRKLFLAYSMDDVIQTERLYNIYSQRIIASANMLTCPMMQIHHASSGQKSYIALYRECRKNGFYSVARNKDRYAGLYERSQKYQGASVDCYKTGYFPRTIYADCSSMYPSIMHDYNISFDRYTVEDTFEYSEPQEPTSTTKLWEDEAKRIGLTDLKPKMISMGDPKSRTIYVPDDNYRVVFKYRINLVDDGFMRKTVDHFNKIRKGYRTKAKAAYAEAEKTGDTAKKIEAMMYESMQQEAKVLNNTFYGVLAQKYYEIADLPAAVFVTAMGRWLISEITHIFEESVIERDTDGVLLDRDKIPKGMEDMNTVTELMKKRQHDFFGVPINKLNFLLEFEGQGSVYMYKQKNYILRKDADGGKLTTRGIAFTGYDKAPVIQKAVKILSSSTMKVGQHKDISYHDARRMALDFRELPMEWFKFTKTLRKNPGEYKGFEGIDVYVRNFDLDSSHDIDKLKEMKKRAKEYLDNKHKNEKDAGKIADMKSFKQLIRDCVTVDQLNTVLGVISSTEEMGNKRGRGRHFMLTLILKLLSRGRTVEEDDVMEYFYSKTSEQFTLAEDMKGKDMLDYERYERDIEQICQRFSLADTSKAEFDLGLL